MSEARPSLKSVPFSNKSQNAIDGFMDASTKAEWRCSRVNERFSLNNSRLHGQFAAGGSNVGFTPTGGSSHPRSGVGAGAIIGRANGSAGRPYPSEGAGSRCAAERVDGRLGRSSSHCGSPGDRRLSIPSPGRPPPPPRPPRCPIRPAGPGPPVPRGSRPSEQVQIDWGGNSGHPQRRRASAAAAARSPRSPRASPPPLRRPSNSVAACPWDSARPAVPGGRSPAGRGPWPRPTGRMPRTTSPRSIRA